MWMLSLFGARTRVKPLRPNRTIHSDRLRGARKAKGPRGQGAKGGNPYGGPLTARNRTRLRLQYQCSEPPMQHPAATGTGSAGGRTKKQFNSPWPGSSCKASGCGAATLARPTWRPAWVEDALRWYTTAEWSSFAISSGNQPSRCSMQRPANRSGRPIVMSPSAWSRNYRRAHYGRSTL